MSDVFYSIGVDLAQAHDFTAISVVETQVWFSEALHHKYPWRDVTPDAWNSPATLRPEALQVACQSADNVWPASKPPLHLRHLERMRHRPYPEIVEIVATMLTGPPFTACGYALCVDATGVGAAVVDLFRQAGVQVIAITIHGGDSASRVRGGYRVPKRDLVGSLQSVLQTGRLQIADGLELGAELRREAMNFKIRIDPKTAHDSYSHWREGDHDDLILSVAMATWGRDFFCRSLDTDRRRRAQAAQEIPAVHSGRRF
jgi:hypothetical protein